MATKWDVNIAHVECDLDFAKDLKGEIIYIFRYFLLVKHIFFIFLVLSNPAVQTMVIRYGY